MTNGRDTCQCSFSRSGDPSSGIFRVSCTPQRMIDLASWWTNTRERATISQDICRRLWPTEPWQDYHRNGPTHHICLISAISLYHIWKHIIDHFRISRNMQLNIIFFFVLAKATKALALNVCHVERSWLKFEEDWNQNILSKVDVFVRNPMEEVNYSTGVRTPAVSPYTSM